MKHTLRGLCVVVFLIGAGAFLQAQIGSGGTSPAGQSPAGQSVDVSDAQSSQPFVIEYVSSSVDPNGIGTVTGSKTRYVKADGEWRIVIRRNHGQAVPPEGAKEVAVYGGTPEGVYEKKDSSMKRRYVSPSSDQTILRLYRSPNYLRSHPDFVRTDEVAGIKVYVLRTWVDPANAGQWEEISYSPSTGLAPLRTVTHFSDGSEIREDAVSVEFKEVPEDLNGDLKSLPLLPIEKKIQKNR